MANLVRKAPDPTTVELAGLYNRRWRQKILIATMGRTLARTGFISKKIFRSDQQNRLDGNLAAAAAPLGLGWLRHENADYTSPGGVVDIELVCVRAFLLTSQAHRVSPFSTCSSPGSALAASPRSSAGCTREHGNALTGQPLQRYGCTSKTPRHCTCELSSGRTQVAGFPPIASAGAVKPLTATIACTPCKTAHLAEGSGF